LTTITTSGIIREEVNTMDYKTKRISLGLSQTEVAKSVGISLVAYQNIERGATKNPKPETLKKLDKVLGGK
jgi:transcriptional regulator with XRE-family HTH domain